MGKPPLPEDVEGGSSDVAKTMEDEGEPVTGAPPTPGSSTSGTSKPARSCLVPGCRVYSDTSLKRHLQKVHVMKGDISQEDMERIFVLATAGKKKFGSIKAVKGRKAKQTGKKPKTAKRRRRWCPVEDCQFLGAYLPQHLVQVHNLDNKGLCISLLVFC